MSNTDDDALTGLFESFENNLRELDPHDLFGAKGGMDVDDDAHVLEPAYELGREMILIRRPHELCLGIVARTRVCVDDSKTCAFANHQKEKFQSPFGEHPFLAMLGPKSKNGTHTFYKDPVLPVSDVDDDLINHLLSLESKDANLAGTINMIIKSGITDLMGLKDSNNLLRTVRKRVNITKTPAKMQHKDKIEELLGQLGTLQSQLGDAMSKRVTSDVAGKLLEFSSSDSEVLPLIVDIFNQQATFIETLSKRLRNTISALQLVGNIHKMDMSQLNQTVEGITSHIETIEGTLGKRSAEAAGLSEPSLWGQANASNRRLDTAEQLLIRVKDKLIAVARSLRQNSHFSGELGSKMTDESATTSTAEYQADEDTVMRDINQFSSGKRIENGILRPPMAVTMQRGANEYATSAEDLRGIRVTGGVHGNNGGGNQGAGFNGMGGQGGNGNNGGNNGRNHLANMIQDQLDTLERRLHNLEKDDNTNVEILRFQGRIFHCPEDVGAMFETELGVGSKLFFSCFAGPNTVIDAVFRSKNPPIRDAKVMKVLKDLGLREQEMDAFLSADYKQSLPNILSHDKRLAQHQYKTKPADTPNARFPALPSGEDMGTDGDNVGLQTALNNSLNQVQDAFTSDINRQLHQSPVLLALATQMLAVSVTFVRTLFSFMSQTFQHLKATFDGEEQAWACVCNSVFDLWNQYFLPMKTEMASVDFNDPENLGSLVVWTNLRMVIQSQKLSTTSLSSNPAVSSSYIRFLIEHLSQKRSNPNADILAQIKTLKAGLAESKKSIGLLQGQLKSVESRADKLQGQLNTIKGKK